MDLLIKPYKRVLRTDAIVNVTDVVGALSWPAIAAGIYYADQRVQNERTEKAFQAQQAAVAQAAAASGRVASGEAK